MNGVICAWSCDWCGGELKPFPNAKSGIRCIRCWRTEGKDDGKFHHVKRTDPEHYLNKGVRK